MAVPVLDSRSYQDLVDDALARIPIHNPEWTNFNSSDPGVTLIELFAFLTESLLYRANQIPERNRQKFLSLLGVPMAPASSARGVITVANTHGAAVPVPVSAGFEVSAGKVPFAAERGLDVLPVEGLAMFKQVVDNPPQSLIDYHKQLYASFQGVAPSLTDLQLYNTITLDPQSPDGVTVQATADGSLWIALLLRKGQDPVSDVSIAAARAALAGATLSVGFVPIVQDPSRVLEPIGTTGSSAPDQLTFQVPLVPLGGVLPADPAKRVPQYRTLDARALADVLNEPGVVEVTLPVDGGLGLWTNLAPTEAGVGDFPPSLEDTDVAARVVTWLRIKAATGAQVAFQWAGINATTVSQRVHVAGEVPGTGTGEPDQQLALAHVSVIADSVSLSVGDPPQAWTLIDDLLAAGPEVPVPDLRLPPGVTQPPPAPANVFALDPAAGVLQFGDGARGARPPAVAVIRVDYDYGLGTAGNVGAGAITSAPSLPTGMTVTNPVRTWGGAEAEAVEEGEKQAARYLQHRDRLVTVEDFETNVWRTPGIELGRVDVVPAFSPVLGSNAPGDAPGAVTVMVVPRQDPVHPDAPEPDRPFIDAVCGFIDQRRLVTTQVCVCGPNYRQIWVSAGIDVLAGLATSDVVQAARQELMRFLAPVDPTLPPWYVAAPQGVDQPYVHPERGWPLRKSIVALELMAVLSRVAGVDYVNSLYLAEGSAGPKDSIPLSGLDLPRVLGVHVVAGDALDLDQVRGLTPEPSQGKTTIPVPLVPETC
jgi:Baseplate J-like protein